MELFISQYFDIFENQRPSWIETEWTLYELQK